MNKKFIICIVILVSAFFAGCATSTKAPQISVEDQRKHLTRDYYQKAMILEDQNKLIQAKQNYKLAITADPLNTEARKGLVQINKHLQSKAENLYLKSLSLLKKGKYNESRRYLLITLGLWPGHVKARQALMAGQKLKIQKFTWHTIKKGETLSKISKIFYGSFKLSSTIALVNNIKDAAAIRVGMKLKIPELLDHPFVNQKKTDKITLSAHESPAPEEKADPLAKYKNLGIDFFKNREFKNAVIELKKVVTADPADMDSKVYISKAYYNLGESADTKKEYLAAIENFKTALYFDNNCPSCKGRIKQTRSLYKEHYYKSGMKFFDEQNLNMAISQWELVQTMDPDYKKVTELLGKAKTIQKNIKVIRQAE